jgi:hypothetical protein
MAGPMPDSAFISAEAISRDIKFPNGETHALEFKRLRARQKGAFYGMNMDDAESTQDVISKAIMASLVDSDGKPYLSFEQADSLHSSVRHQVMQVINEINKEEAGNA